MCVLNFLQFKQHDSCVLGRSWFSHSRGFVTSGEDRRIFASKLEALENDPNSFALNGGNLMVAIERMQAELTNLASTMSTLDKRLFFQEEKLNLQWLDDIDESISKVAQSS
mgnify:CR=1 FL=1